MKGILIAPASVAAQQPQAERHTDTLTVGPRSSPCQDFYAYVNGNTPTGPDSTAAEPLEGPLFIPTWLGAELNRSMQDTWRQILEHARTVASTTADPLTRVLGDWYGSCLAADTAELAARRPWHCVAATDSQFQPALAQASVQAVLTPTVKPQLLAFMEQLRAAMRERIAAARWLSDANKQDALHRLNALAFNLGDTGTSTPEDYTGLVLSPTAYADNLRALDAFRYQQYLTSIHTRASVETSADAWCDPYAMGQGGGGKLCYPVIHWLSPGFVLNGDPAWNFGGLGSLFAHEMTHSFAPGGILTDTAASHRLRARMVLTYNLLAGEDSLRGTAENTFLEDFADLGGLRIAYEAFEQALQKLPRRRRNGLTPEQRFFVAHATYFRPKRGVTATGGGGGNYASLRDRVNRPLANMPAFAQAFGCKVGDPMVVPADRRVVIW